jgi:hypothetical protein
MKATITLSMNQSGALDMLTNYEGGFNASNQAHQAALLLGAKMSELAEPQGPAREPDAEEFAQLQGLAEPMPAAEPVQG